jgi:hypothetical protein
MATWPLPLRTLVISSLMVVGLTWLVIPYLTRIFAGWLAPTPPAANGQHRERARPARFGALPQRRERVRAYAGAGVHGC